MRSPSSSGACATNATWRSCSSSTTCTSSRGSPIASSRSTTARRSPRARSTTARPILRSSSPISAATPTRWRRNDAMTGALLALDQVTTYYGQMRILEGISLQVHPGELVCLLGGNASGKSTTLKTVLGIVRPRAGAVMVDGEDVTARSVPERIARGLAIVPENRRLFGDMTVRENLELGATLRRGEDLSDDFERVHTLFPRVYERRNQLAGTLSGGEQQMVAIGRALMSRPRLLLMDEPSMGLAPALVQQNFRIIKQVHEDGVAILMVEQNATMALSIADRGYVLATGEIVLADRAEALLESEDLKRAYLGR